MSTLEELEQRVETLEAEIAAVRHKASEARALASGADHDVADLHAKLRADTGTLNALRKTQVEQGEKIDQLTGTVNHIRDQHGAKLNDIASMLTRLIDES